MFFFCFSFIRFESVWVAWLEVIACLVRCVLSVCDFFFFLSISSMLFCWLFLGLLVGSIALRWLNLKCYRRLILYDSYSCALESCVVVVSQANLRWVEITFSLYLILPFFFFTQSTIGFPLCTCVCVCLSISVNRRRYVLSENTTYPKLISWFGETYTRVCRNVNFLSYVDLRVFFFTTRSVMSTHSRALLLLLQLKWARQCALRSSSECAKKKKNFIGICANAEKHAKCPCAFSREKHTNSDQIASLQNAGKNKRKRNARKLGEKEKRRFLCFSLKKENHVLKFPDRRNVDDMSAKRLASFSAKENWWRRRWYGDARTPRTWRRRRKKKTWKIKHENNDEIVERKKYEPNTKWTRFAPWMARKNAEEILQHG